MGWLRVTERKSNGKVREVAFGDRHFRHELRNVRNSLGLALRAFEISSEDERLELIDMVIETADQAIALLDANDPDAPEAPGSTESAN